MEYLAKFDNSGHRETTVVKGVHYDTDKERQAYLNAGYILISDDDYQQYTGNRDMGDNGTGYIRDTKTGKPISAPSAPHTEPELDDPPIDETQLAIFEAMAAQETRLAEQDARIAELLAALKARKGGDSK